MKQKILTLILILAIIALVVIGYFGYKNYWPITRISPTPSTDRTVNWKTYTNPTTGISFKYPPEWEYTESKTFNSVTFNTKIKSQEKRGDQFLDFVFEVLLGDQRNYNEWVNNPGQTQSLDTEQINNLSFEKFIVADMYYSLNYIYKSPDGKIVRFMIWPHNAQDTTKFPTSLKNTINQILSTFTFSN